MKYLGRAWASLAIFCLLNISAGIFAADSVSWKAGVAKTVVTPSDRMWLTGFADRTAPAEGKAQDLFAKALILEDIAGTQFVIVTTDLIGIPLPLRKVVEKHVGQKYKLPPAAVLLNASHTHCGPELLYAPEDLEGLDADRVATGKKYIAELEAKILGVIDEAFKNIAPAKLRYSHARCGFAMNRRLKNDKADGDPYLNRPNPNGVVDHDVPVLSVTSADDGLRAILFGYACHNTTTKGLQYSGDYAGYAQEFLEKSHPDAVAMFVTGCGGDQNGYPRFTADWSPLHGRSLATTVEAALQSVQTSVRGPLSFSLKSTMLEYAKPPTREQLAEKLKRTENEKKSPFDKYERQHAERLLRQYERDGDVLREYPCLLQTVRFGDDLLLIALPGEPVVDYSLRLKRELAGKANVWVAGYNNDVFAYLPSRRVLLEGGYEPVRSMNYSVAPLQPGPFAESVEENIVAKVHQMVKELQAPKFIIPKAKSDVQTIYTAVKNGIYRSSRGDCYAFLASTELDTIYTGQILPIDNQGEFIGQTKLSEQANQIFENLTSVLEMAGADLKQIVKLNIYLRDVNTADQVDFLLTQKFTDDARMATTYVVTRLPHPEALVAIDAVAMTKTAKAKKVTMGKWEKQTATSFAILPAGPRVYVSGQAEKGDGTLAGATQKTLEGLLKSLKFCGLDRADIVQLKVFWASDTDTDPVVQAIKDFFPDQSIPPVVLVEWKSTLPVEIELVASARKGAADAPPVEYLTPPELTKSPLFSRIVRVNASKLIYVSGILTGKAKLPADEEVRNQFISLKESLQPAGSDLEHLVKATYYIIDAETSTQLGKIRPDFYHSDRPPAASKAEVTGIGFPHHRLTIDMIAVPK